MKKEGAVKVFANEAEFEAEYERFLGGLPEAGKRIRDTHEAMEVCFRDYLDAFERWVFRHAYACGYAAAMSAAKDTEDGGLDGNQGM